MSNNRIRAVSRQDLTAWLGLACWHGINNVAFILTSLLPSTQSASCRATRFSFWGCTVSSNGPKDYLASRIHFGKDFSWQKILVVHHSKRLADFAKHLSLFLIKFELVQFPMNNLYKSIFVIFFFLNKGSWLNSIAGDSPSKFGLLKCTSHFSRPFFVVGTTANLSKGIKNFVLAHDEYGTLLEDLKVLIRIDKSWKKVRWINSVSWAAYCKASRVFITCWK